MTNSIDADVSEILGGQLWQHHDVDLVLEKGFLVLLQPETVEPLRNVHVRLPAGRPAWLIVLRIWERANAGVEVMAVRSSRAYRDFTSSTATRRGYGNA